MSNRHDIIRLRRGTAAEWTASLPQPGGEVLKLGEPGFEKDTFKLKIGDGINGWNDLPYIDGGMGGNDGPLEYIYDVDMGSDSNITPSNLYFSSQSNYVDYSNFFNELISNEYGTTFKLTNKNDPNKFLLVSSNNISRFDYNTGNIDAFWPSSSIKWIIDGGDDQYDSANFINNNITYPTTPTSSPGSSTLRTTSIPYNSGRVATNSRYWGNNDYVTLYKKSIFAMVSRGSAVTMPTTVFYAGNAGADGDGDKDVGSLNNYGGYQAGYCRLWGDDPTYTKLIITKTGSIPVYSTDNSNDTNDDLFIASGINSDTVAMVVFYGADTSNPSSLTDIQSLFESFVDNVLSGTNVSDIKNNFYNNFSTIYDTVDPGFWYENFEFFTGTNAGSANYIIAEGGSGSNLELTVTVNQDTMQYTFGINNAGSDYVSGDVVVLRGNNLLEPDGRSPDEDIYIKIDSVGGTGDVLTFSPIIYFGYTVSIDKILVRSDGFRFIDNEVYYLNIDIVGASKINDPLDNRLLTSNGTVSGINAEPALTFDGYRLLIDCDCPTGTAGLTVVGDDRSTLIASSVFADPELIETEDGEITTRQTSRLIFRGSRGTQASPSGLLVNDNIFILRGDATNPYGTLNANGVVDNRTARIRCIVSDDGTDYLGSSWFIETSSGGSGLYDQSLSFNHEGLLSGPYANFTQVYPTVVSGGSISGSVVTDVSTGQIFDITVTGSTTLSNPINPVDGVTIRWRITQDGTGGHSVSLDTKFVIPSSASSPLPWSTAANAMDILAATYHAGRDKWDIVAFVPGY